MSINVTVHGSPVHIRKKKMLLVDYEEMKKSEVNRRRKLRIQQVRQQSKDIARKVRQEVKEEHKKQLKLLEEQMLARQNKRQAKKLLALQQKYHECLQEVGMGHTLAALQPDPEKVLSAQQECNRVQAAARSQEAKERLQQERLEIKEHREAALKRQRATRTMEDLRAAMVASLGHDRAREVTSSDDPDSASRLDVVSSPPLEGGLSHHGVACNCLKDRMCECVVRRRQARVKTKESDKTSPLTSSDRPYSEETSHTGGDMLMSSVSTLRERGSSLLTVCPPCPWDTDISTPSTETAEQSGREHRQTRGGDIEDAYSIPAQKEKVEDADKILALKEGSKADSSSMGIVYQLKSPEGLVSDSQPPKPLQVSQKEGPTPRQDRNEMPQVDSHKRAPCSISRASNPSEPLATKGGDTSRSSAAKTRAPSKVQLYDHSARYEKLCDTQHRVQRLRADTQPDAEELARREEGAHQPVMEEGPLRFRALGRGHQALAQLRVSQDYQQLVDQLALLTKEERRVRSHHTHVDVYLNEERRKERNSRRQKDMDSAFERVYHSSATATGCRCGLVHQSDANIESCRCPERQVPITLDERRPAHMVESPPKLNVAVCGMCPDVSHSSISPESSVEAARVPHNSESSTWRGHHSSSLLQQLVDRVNIQRSILMEEVGEHLAPQHLVCPPSKSQEHLSSVTKPSSPSPVESPSVGIDTHLESVSQTEEFVGKTTAREADNETQPRGSPTGDPHQPTNDNNLEIHEGSTVSIVSEYSLDVSLSAEQSFSELGSSSTSMATSEDIRIIVSVREKVGKYCSQTDQVLDCPQERKRESSFAKKHKPASTEKRKSLSAEKLKPASTEKHKPTSTEQHKPVSIEKYRSSSTKEHRSSSTEEHRSSSTEKHKPISTEEHRSSATEKNEPALAEEHKPASTEKQKPASTEKHKTGFIEKQKPASIKKHKLASAEKQKPSSTEKQKSASAEEQKSESAEKQKYVFAEKHNFTFADKQRKSISNKIKINQKYSKKNENNKKKRKKVLEVSYERHKMIKETQELPESKDSSAEHVTPEVSSVSTVYLSPPHEMVSEQADRVDKLLSDIHRQKEELEQFLDKQSSSNSDKTDSTHLKSYISQLLKLSRQSVEELNVSEVSDTPDIPQTVGSDRIHSNAKSDNTTIKVAPPPEQKPPKSAKPKVSRVTQDKVPTKKLHYHTPLAPEFVSKSPPTSELTVPTSETNSVKQPLAREPQPRKAPSIIGTYEKVSASTHQKVPPKPETCYCPSEASPTFFPSLSALRNGVQGGHEPGGNPAVFRNFNDCSKKHTDRISSLSEMIEQIRREKQMLLESSSDSQHDSTKYISPPESWVPTVGARPPRPDLCFCPVDDSNLRSGIMGPPSSQPVCSSRFGNHIRPHELSTIVEVDTPQSSQFLLAAEDSVMVDDNQRKDTADNPARVHETEDTLREDVGSDDTLPDVMAELMRRQLITSPFLWSKQVRENNPVGEQNSEDQTDARLFRQQTDTHLFRQQTDPHLFRQQTDVSRSHKQTDASQSHEQTDASRSHEQTDASRSHEQTDASRSHGQTDASRSHGQTDASRPHGQTDSRLPHELTDSRLPHGQSYICLSHDQTDVCLSHDLTDVCLSHDLTDACCPETSIQNSSQDISIEQFKELILQSFIGIGLNPSPQDLEGALQQLGLPLTKKNNKYQIMAADKRPPPRPQLSTKESQQSLDKPRLSVTEEFKKQIMNNFLGIGVEPTTTELESAFGTLGVSWAGTTLRKTKEAEALSPSSGENNSHSLQSNRTENSFDRSLPASVRGRSTPVSISTNSSKSDRNNNYTTCVSFPGESDISSVQPTTSSNEEQSTLSVQVPNVSLKTPSLNQPASRRGM